MLTIVAIHESQRYSPTYPEPDEKPELEELQPASQEDLPLAPPSKWSSTPALPDVTREELERMRVDPHFGEYCCMLSMVSIVNNRFSF